MGEIAGIKLQMDMQDFSCGNFYDFKPDNIERTAFLFVLKDKQNFWQEYRKIEHEGYQIDIRNYIVKNEKEDPFLGYINSINIGVGISGIDTIPLHHFTDHKKEYPIYFAEIIVHGLIKYWDLKYEKPDEILGPPQSKDKIFALSAWNKAIRINENYKKLSYEDVTFLGQYYFEKSLRSPKYTRCLALTTRTAYRDGVVNYLFKNDLYDFLVSRNDNLKKEINTIEELKTIVYDVFIDVFKHHIEDRRWIEAFWDGKKKIKFDDKIIEIPMEPKNETSIQPTLHVILMIVLNQYGIHVERETSEGIGSLDFKCLFTTKERKILILPIEFKLAHHKRLKHGIETQLPKYMKAVNTEYGFYVVFWFKDKKGKYFKKPSERDKEGTIQWLNDEAANLKNNKKLLIQTILIDASIKISASS